MPIQYSPLCDSDLSAYLAYCFSNGPGAIKVGGVAGSRGGVKCDGGCIDVAGAVDGFLSSVFTKRAAHLVEYSGGSGVVCDGDHSYRCLCHQETRFAGGRADTIVDFGGDRDNNSCDVNIECASSDADGIAVEAHVAEVKEFVGVNVGTNYERNKKNREQKKRRKHFKRIQQGKIDADGVHSGLDYGVFDRRDVRKLGTWRREEKVQDVGKKEVFSFDCVGETQSDESVCVSDQVSRGVDEKRKSVLRSSLEDKWCAENALAAARAKRQLEILERNDIDAEVNRYRTQVRVATEKNMVAIEKNHGYLKSTDNVPRDELDHDVHTVVDSVPTLASKNSNSISPDSSASQAEFRRVQKDLLDSESRVARLEAALEKIGLSVEAIDVKEKSIWTDTPENHKLLDQLYPEGYPMITEFCEDGKFSIF